MKEVNPNDNLRALVHVMVPKLGTLQWSCMPNAHFVILLDAAYEYISAEEWQKSNRVTAEFIECWRTVAEVREYAHRFNMLAVTSHFIINEILNGTSPAKIDGKIVDELMKYSRKPAEVIDSIVKGINSGRSDFYVIKRWLTHLGKFDEVAKLMDERKSKPKPPRKAVKKHQDSSIDDIMEKLKSDPRLLAKVKKML